MAASRSGWARNLAVLVATAAACSALTACGTSSKDAPKAKGSDATAKATIKPGGTLTLGSAQGIEQIDPNTINSAAQQQLLTLLWNGLTKWAPGMKTAPDLAQSWTSSPDAKSWTFKLRSGVKYHDGRPFTADDAVKNIERVLNPKVPAQVAAKLSAIDKATAVDPTTLKITLKRSNPNLPTDLVELKMTDVDHIKQINKTANGTGPYKLARFIPGDRVSLVRNPEYWGAKGNFAKLDLVRSSDETAAEGAFRGGDLDVLWSVPPSAVNGLAKATAGQVLESSEPAGAVVWELDTTSKPFDNPKARLALAYAADRTKMFQAAYAGRGVVNPFDAIVNPKNQFFAQGMTSHDFDLDKAKQLFAEAGVKSGDTLTYWTTSGAFPEWTTIGEILQQDLKKIGITLKIKANEISTWSQHFYPRGKKFPNEIVVNFLSFPPLPSAYSLTWFGGGPGTCECNWKAPASYTSALDVATGSPDADARKEAFTTLQKSLNQEVPAIVLANSALLSVAQKNVTGAWVQADGGVHLEQAGFTDGGSAGA
jgi:peptide/nickel transport system substrate-binding protein